MARTRPTLDEIRHVIDRVPEAPPEGTFEIALVLGGTVSAGAYTAGFVDMLVEALDAWYVAKANDRDAPPHDVKLKVATGASGGAVCASILARALSVGFPPVRPTSDEATRATNPFYHIWVNMLDIKGMADTGDINDGKVLKSLLNGAAIDDGTKYIVERFQGGPLPHPDWEVRPYVDNPFRVIVTLANLRGVPYRIDFGDGNSQTYISHADYARFACDVSHTNRASFPPGTPRPDEFLVQREGRAGAVHWGTLGSYARASGAFPIGFPARRLDRPLAHYDYRAMVLPSDTGTPLIAPLEPVWDGVEIDETYHFLAIDGGTFNNEPIELARTELAGLTGRNFRDKEKANRAVVLVDPLPKPPSLGPSRFGNLIGLGGSTLSALIDQGRYSTGDLTLMAHPDAFSRFMVVPRRRDRKKGEQALATAGLGAFIGFFEPAFRRHDYILGRINCQQFLRDEFVLDATNPLFAGWSDLQRHQFAVPGGYLPIIPRLGDAAMNDDELPWPKGRLTPEAVHGALKGRVEAIVEKLADNALDYDLLTDRLIRAMKGWTADQILAPVTGKVREDLRAWNLD